MTRPCVKSRATRVALRGDPITPAATAVKHAIARQIEREMKVQRITKTMMAARMHTSRAALNRLLDAADTGLTLTTLASAALVLGAKLNVELVHR
jgi:sRNA-binding protein